ncbi:MerR family transcriptional regulator [Nitratifractor salsuginis]|uniref:Regulatory protein MerR n=1 Tax=Nitratifractor salsuginis (strain DSM 16511 / JCM 12458 / E9I37-1) TaxID=749222 RepID=E6X2A7_NITSE|nr:MerR family transcriptional regulator [Nitratifractor salsuginis]ADV46042.1 regulatory protein MerR [Nitratifractor salsuginis DSM 16511]
MALKMKDLVQLTDTPKSTILYYIKEGLLPEPEKPKPNVHLYDESFVERIKFIKYLQKNFNASIDQIRELMQREEFDLSRGYESILDTLDLLMAPPSPRRYTKEELCKAAEIDCDRLDHYLINNVIFERDGGFSEKELEILRILKELEAVDPDGELVQAYVAHARSVARSEVDLAQRLIEYSFDTNRTIKALFDATLILKPYLFNMQLFETYRQRFGDRHKVKETS